MKTTLRISYLLAFILAFSAFSYSQNAADALPLPDSLVGKLKENRGTDLKRVEALNDVIMFYYDKHEILEAQTYIHELSKIAEELKEHYWESIGDYYSAIYNLESKNYSEAFMELNDLLNRVETHRLTNRTRLLLGRIYLAKSSYYISMNMFPESYEVIQKGLDVLEGVSASTQSRLLNNLGVIHNETKNYDDAIEVIKQALIGEKLSMYYENISTAYDGKESYDSALIYIDSALQVSTSNFDSLAINHLKGILYYRHGELDNAEHLFEDCLENVSSRPDYLYLKSVILHNVSAVALEKDNFSKALEHAEEAIQISRNIQDENEFLLCTKLKAMILNTMGDYENAIKCMLEYDSIHDVLLMHQNKDKLTEIIHQQKTRMMEQQFETERQITKQRQKFIIIITAILLIFVVTLVYFIIKDKRQKEVLLQQELSLRNREITSKTMNQLQNNKVLSEVIEKLTHIENNPKGNGNDLPVAIRELKGMIDDGSMKDFDYYFVQVHPDFYTKLKADFPKLTQNELRLCALIKANLNIKDIANLNNVSIDSVKSSRKRLRKSLSISDPKIDLAEFLSKY